MRAHKLDVGDLHPVRKGDDEPVFVACNVEDDPVVSNNTGVSVLRFDLGWGFPCTPTGLSVPSFQSLFCVITPRFFPEGLEGGNGNDAHIGILVPYWDQLFRIILFIVDRRTLPARLLPQHEQVKARTIASSVTPCRGLRGCSVRAVGSFMLNELRPRPSLLSLGNTVLIDHHRSG